MALCYGCMKRGHRSSDCRRRATCRTCKGRHPTALHIHRQEDRRDEQQTSVVQEDRRDEQQTNVVREDRRDQQQASATTCHIKGDTGSRERPVLPVVSVVVSCGNQQIRTRAFLDSGSTHSFASTDLVRRLGLSHVPAKKLFLTTVDREVSIASQVVSGLSISDIEGGNHLALPQLYTLDRIPVCKDEFPTQADVDQWEHLRDIELPVQDEEEVGLLLGANAFLAMEPLEVLPSRGGSPYAVRTRYGWTISGVGNRETTPKVCRISAREEAGPIEELVRDLYNREYEENLHTTKKGLSVEDKEWQKVVDKSTTQQEGHYVIDLSVSNEEVKLPNNRKMAARRLDGLKSKFKRNEKFAHDYIAYIEDLLKKGHAEPVPEENMDRGDGKVWYLPHHAVYHPHKRDKIRVVFDCAARYQGVSLNECLMQGPNNTNALLDVLLRFRGDDVAFIADIESMFHQVEVPGPDRDYFRFLWWQNGNMENQPKEYRMKVHIFGARSSPSVACYALRRTAKDHGSGFPAEVAAIIDNNFYVDDVLKATQNQETAISMARDLKELCKTGGFNLTKFSSNSAAVIHSVPVDDRSKEMKMWAGSGEMLPAERTLGIVWETESDCLKISLDIQGLRSRPMTRKGLLSAVSSLYDPLGMVAPSVLCGRLILQELCRLQVEWDSETPPAQQRQWKDWLMSITKISQLDIPRCIKPPGFGCVKSYQIHHFADASEVAYGTVSYIRMTNSAGAVHCSFVMGKAHLAPLKTVTIPRLELMAAVTAVRVSSLISDAFEFEASHHFWSDSTTVLRYIANRRTRFHTFVANRLAIIRDGSSPEQWRHVDSKSNPADDVSRGVQNARWLTGPSFLWEQEECWPEKPAALQEMNESDPEVKTMTVGVLKLQEEQRQDPMEKLLAHYSKKEGLLRGLAWILRVRRALITKKATRTRLGLADLHEAEQCVVKWVQVRSFSEEYADLKDGKEVARSSKIVKLSPFMLDGIIRVGGRLREASVTEVAKHPIVMPSEGRYTELLMQSAHVRTGHSGRQHVLAEIRKRFWVLKANAVARRVVGRCLACVRRHRRPETQKMSDLPFDRVQALEPPFTRTGVDYFGPFFVRQGRSQVKRYGVIFTCLSMRAIHVEVAEDLSSDSFICALRRFVARRGCVQILRSDRGTNFIGANRELQEELVKMAASEERLHRAMLTREVEWKFNTSGASHHGGVWERQIRSIRRILDALITPQPLREETLRTFLCEVESILNSRPLTPVSCDPRDLEPLTPNHILLLGAGNVMVPFGIVDDADSVSRKRWKQARYLASVFWRRWRAEYLPLLQERPYVMTRRRANLAIGDTVLVVDSSVPRGQWPLGVVVNVKAGADDLVRSVQVKVRGVVLQRPVTKLVKL